MEKRIEDVVGGTFEDMNPDEMELTQGAGDVEAETTPAAVSAIVSAVSGAIVSAAKC
ncbi:MAG: lichenicidin A2 family type 2 lantibiotic [Butyrivibrio sp.]|nr:lichenicidin A2 family type 2 lantibiotic [Butyrivibrio sp.]